MYTIDSTEETHRDFTISITWHYDECADPPWENSDMHGPVSKWETRDKAPGEWVLCSDRHSKRFYDHQEAMKLARKDGWGLPAEDLEKVQRQLGRALTHGEIAVAAVERDFIYLRDWCNDKWQYVGYKLTVTSPDGEEMDEAGDSLWCIDSPSMEYFQADAFATAKEWIDKEVVAAADAAARDIATA